MARKGHHSSRREPSRSGRWIVAVAGLVVVGSAAVFLLRHDPESSAEQPAPPAQVPAQPAPAAPQNVEPRPPSELLTMEVAKAVMVTAELDFGAHVPSIAEALREIDRRYTPSDGAGRTFAILDAYGEPTPDGKLHISMHVSSEKPGMGSLVFRRTGQVLWQSRIVPSPQPPAVAKNLGILIDNGSGTTYTVDGSSNPASVLGARIRELNVPVSQFWPDGAEREVTFIYSMCGCPVKVMARRVGSRTERTKELPVIFPDDPAAAATIAQLMGWR